MAAQQTGFWDQFEVAEYDKPQYDWGQFEEVPQNQHALESSLNELPADDPYVQTQDYEVEQLANLLFTKEELQGIRDKGPMGWIEFRQRDYYKWRNLVPIYGDIKDTGEAKGVQKIAEKIENGEEVTEAERNHMTQYMRDYIELQIRGMSWGGQAVKGGLDLFPFMGAFLLGNAVGAGGAAAIRGGTSAAMKAAGKAITKNMVKSTVNAAAKKGIKAAAVSTVTENAGAITTLVPIYAVKNYNERKLSDGLNMTDKGEQFFNEDATYSVARAEEHKIANTFKGLGDATIEIGSELTGGAIGHIAGKATGLVKNTFGKVVTTNTARGISAVTAKVYNQLPKKTRIKLEAAARVADNLGKSVAKMGSEMKNSGKLAGYNGVWEEFGEERVADLLKVAFDLDDEKGYSPDQFLHALVPKPQQILLELGLFSIGGSMSYASKTLFNDLKSKGYSEQEATTISQNLSEIEKENLANDILGEVKINEDITEQEVIKEQVKLENKILQGGVSLNVNEQGEEIKEKPKNLTDYKKDILSNKFNSDIKLETVKGSYKNNNYTKTLKTLNNAITLSERKFDDVISEIYKNPTIVNDTQAVEKLDSKIDGIVSQVPDELIEDYYNRYYNAINSAAEYSKAKESRSKKVAAELYDMADTAGATPSQEQDAIKEWQEKGTESKYFKKWFGDSKVVDSEGKPLVVYHGTPEGGFSIFNEGSYFTANKNYAENYTKTGASALKVHTTANNPQLYPVYLSIKTPFDTRNTKEKNIFLNEYRAYYSPELSERGLVDWMEVEDLAEWLKENHPEYDGIFADEGGYLDENNNTHLRGISYVPFFSTQIKSVDNQGTFDENNPNIYYDVEEETPKKNKEISIKPINIEKDSIPNFKDVKDLKNWIFANLPILGDVTIKDNGRKVFVGKTGTSRSMKDVGRSEPKKDSYKKLREIIENAIKYNPRNTDERHPNVLGQEIYHNAIFFNGKPYGVEISVDIPKIKNAPYNYAGHKIKEIKIAPAVNGVASNEVRPDNTDANISINDIRKLFNPSVKNNELYDVSEEAPKKTEAPITQEAKTVEDELETSETVADKIIRGESRFGKLYTEWVDRYTPIENLVIKAEQKTGEKLDTSSNPYFQARMYAGLVESIKEQVNDKTFVKENGKIKITGEGFLPIINDYVEQIKDVEPNYDKAIEDLSDYLIANRYLLDLKDRDGYEATEEQKLKAVSDMTKLNLKYGDKIEDISKIADRIYAFNQRILHNLVDSGNMSQETYDKIIEQNPHHISYKRVMDDNGIGQDFFAKPKFTDAKSPIKKIRGSERDIQNIFVSTLEDVSRILDTAERNKVARSVANLKDILPEYIQDKKPAMEKRTAMVKVNYDAKMRQQLLEAIKYFGRTFENAKSIKTPTGYAYGAYSEEEKLIRKKLGSQDRTLAHEVGHMLDYALDVEDQIKNNSDIMQEIKTLAEDRFASVIKLQDGEYVTEEAGSSEKYKRYAKTNKEMIANAFDLYFTSRDYVKRVAPETAKFIDNLFKGEYAFLNEIRPSSESATEEIEQDVWTPSRNKPYGNVIQYFVDGKPKFVEVTKPVMDAVEGMNSQEIDFINKFMVGSASMLRTGATITPEFAIRNFIRDQESAVIYIKNYNPFIDGVKGLFNVLGKKITGKNETYDEWVKAGGAFGSYMELNEKSVNKALKEFVGEGSKMRSIFSYANPLKLAEEFSSTFEQATRLAMYTRSKMNGSDAMQAALEAREGTLDFGRSGSLGRKYNRVLPFFNAGIQGVDKMVRTFRDHPYLSTIKAVGTITLPQLALTGYYLYFAPDDDREEYLNIPQFQKDFFYCFKVGENWVRIPKDFTLGYMFGSVPERFLTWAYQNKKPEGKDLAEMAMTLFGSVSPVNNPTDALPPIFRTAIEDIANYSFFRNQHIYPEYMNSLEPSLRANKFNSETSKLLGEKLNISPAKIDHTISSLLGTSGRYLTDAGDLMINSVRKFNGEEKSEKVKTLADAPFLRGFVLRDPVGYQAVSTNEFFENYKTVSEKHATYNKYKKTDREKAREYKEKHSTELKAYKKMNDTKKQISEIGKQMDKIYSDKTMTSKEKQERLQPLAKRISDMAFDANVWYGNTKE